jgi:hypothetical protein
VAALLTSAMPAIRQIKAGARGPTNFRSSEVNGAYAAIPTPS